MLLERTIFQLDIGYVPPDRAEEMGQLGYLQWLGALPGHANFADEACRALEMAQPFRRTSPAIEVFCVLLMAASAVSPAPLPLSYPGRGRRGGRQARRITL
ncbi:MAG: hypothetical protein ACU0GG_00080 [Paracoccaceae bacterium]